MSGHVLPLRAYFAVFAALLVLTGVTTGVSYVDLGAWNDVVAMTIATVKALLVALIFMHLRWSTRLVQIFALAGVFWLVLLFSLTLGDFETRPLVSAWG